MQIFVKVMSGRTITLTVTRNANIETLREEIWNRERVPSSQQRLLYGGKQLEDGKGLDDYYIFGESTLYLMLRLRGGEGGSSASLGDDKGAVERGAMLKLRTDAVTGLQTERQRRVTDLRQRWAEERAKREIALRAKKLAQTALELERAKSTELEAELAQLENRLKTELAQREGELAQREEEVGTHLETARRMQEQMEYMLKIELVQREEELAQREEEVGAHLEATRRMQDQMEYRLRQEQAEQVKKQAELVRRLRRELQEESYAKRAVQSRLKKAETLIAVQNEQVKEQDELVRSLKLQAGGYAKRAVQSHREKKDSFRGCLEKKGRFCLRCGRAAT
jgi:hypothetical protein